MAYEHNNHSTKNRLDAIHELIECYNEQYKEGGFFINEAFCHKEPPYGGIGAYVRKDVQEGEILFVIPCQERLSYETIVDNFFTNNNPQFKHKTTSSILTKLLREDIINECKRRLPGEFNHQNVCTSLLVMYLFQYFKNSTSSNDNSNNKNTFISNIQTYLQTWPSNESIKEELDWTAKEDDLENLKGTYTHYLIKETNADFEDIIVDIIEEKIPKEYIQYFCCSGSKNDNSNTNTATTRMITRQDIRESLRPAWKLVNSRCHDSVVDFSKSADMMPIIDLTNGYITGSKGINVQIESNYWSAFKTAIADKKSISSTASSSTTNNKDKKSSNRNKKSQSEIDSLKCVALKVIATNDTKKNVLKASTELFLAYGDLPASSFLNKYGCIPMKSFVTESLITEILLLEYPSNLLPKETDLLRTQALQISDYPTTKDELINTEFNIFLTPYRLRDMQCNFFPSSSSLPNNHNIKTNTIFDFRTDEPEQLRLLRQYVILSCVANTQIIKDYMETNGTQLRGAIDAKKIGQCLTQVIDYNIELFYNNIHDTYFRNIDPKTTDTKPTNNSDTNKNINNNTVVERLQSLLEQPQADSINNNSSVTFTFRERNCILQKLLHYDSLAQWRHIICRYYNIPSAVDIINNDDDASKSLMSSLSLKNNTNNLANVIVELNKGCKTCGRIIGRKLCSKCNKVGYCCRNHQICDWKLHKPKCTSSSSK